MFTYYDLVLVTIPLIFVGVLGAGSVAGVALSTAVTGASVIAAGFVMHAMFINPPTGQLSQTAEDQSATVSQRPSDGRTDLSAEFAD